MRKFIFDYNDKDPIFTLNDDIAIDSEGHEMMRMGDNYAVDLRTNQLHYIDNWDVSSSNDIDNLDDLHDDLDLDFGDDF